MARLQGWPVRNICFQFRLALADAMDMPRFSRGCGSRNPNFCGESPTRHVGVRLLPRPGRQHVMTKLLPEGKSMAASGETSDDHRREHICKKTRRDINEEVGRALVPRCGRPIRDDVHLRPPDRRSSVDSQTDSGLVISRAAWTGRSRGEKGLVAISRRSAGSSQVHRHPRKTGRSAPHRGRGASTSWTAFIGLRIRICVTLMAAGGYVVHTFPNTGASGNVIGNPIRRAG